MEFREFIEEHEAALFEEGMACMDEWLGSALKFAAGAAGNAISQTGRSIGNIGSGALQGVYGFGQGAVAAAQRTGGGGEEADKTFKRASANMGAGLRKVGRGLAQGVGVATGLSPMLRGSQAVSEPLFSLDGVYAPGGKDRTEFQDLVGLGSWKRDREERPAEEEPKPKPSAKPAGRPKHTDRQKPRDRAAEFLRDLSNQEKAKAARRNPSRPKTQSEVWLMLVKMYKDAKTKEERDEVRRRMQLATPYLYTQAVEAGERRRAAKKASMDRAV